MKKRQRVIVVAIANAIAEKQVVVVTIANPIAHSKVKIQVIFVVIRTQNSISKDAEG